MDLMLTRGWKQQEKGERSARSYLVCELRWLLAHCPWISHVINIHINLCFNNYSFILSLSGTEQVRSGAACQTLLWTTTAAAQEETPGAEAQRGEEAHRCGGEAQAEAQRGESEFWEWFHCSLLTRSMNWYIVYFWIKERHESAVRRTLEKSQRAQQNLSQNSRGRKLSKNGARPGCALFSFFSFNINSQQSTRLSACLIFCFSCTLYWSIH